MEAERLIGKSVGCGTMPFPNPFTARRNHEKGPLSLRGFFIACHSTHARRLIAGCGMILQSFGFARRLPAPTPRELLEGVILTADALSLCRQLKLKLTYFLRQGVSASIDVH